MNEKNLPDDFDSICGNIIINTPNGAIVTNQNHEIVYLNNAVLEITEAYNKEPSGSVFQFIPELKLIDTNRKDIQPMQLGSSLLHIYCLNLESYIVYLFMDVYESIATQNELKFHRDTVYELEEILEGSYDGILVTDGDGNILLVNKSYERITAIKKEDMIGHNMRDLFNPVWMPNSVAFVAIDEKKAVSKAQVTKEGKNIIVTGVPIFDKKNNIKKVVINARDITEIYQLREELLQSQEREKAYLKNYSEFTDIVAKGEEKIIAVSKEMQDALTLAQKVSNFQATVLILGESGVGKEEVAKHIHSCSLRKNSPFITINCGAIPANLLESELFGYDKGAFTGASQLGKVGLLELADGGVVFLDEIGETPLDFQVKLLRVLETKEVRRVGGVTSKCIDVRIIAATNRKLEEMVEKETFREDLFYRLNVVQINVPPLRNRIEDIVPLSMFFLAQYNQRYGQNKTLTYDVIKKMERFDWPGNVRQLKNVIESMVVVSNNDFLQINDLPWHVNSVLNSKKTLIKSIYENENLSLTEAVETLEKLILTRAKTKHKTTRVMAEQLQVDQSTIVRKLKKYDI